MILTILLSALLAHGGYAAAPYIDDGIDARVSYLEWRICQEPGAQVCLTDWITVMTTPCGWAWETETAHSDRWVCPPGGVTPTEAILAMGLDPPEKSWISVRAVDEAGLQSAMALCQRGPNGGDETCDSDGDGTFEVSDACCDGVDNDGDASHCSGDPSILCSQHEDCIEIIDAHFYTYGVCIGVDEGCVTHRSYMTRDPSSGYCRVEGGPVIDFGPGGLD